MATFVGQSRDQMTLELWYATMLLGHVEEAFEHQGTWFGNFRGATQRSNDRLSCRLDDFMDFCRDWYVRAGSSGGADASEFNAFHDVVRSGLWYTTTQDGLRTKISDAPMFMDGRNGEISWTVLSERNEAQGTER